MPSEKKKRSEPERPFMNLVSDWRPASSSERVRTIDIIRGLALFGVLIVNILSDFRVPLLEHFRKPFADSHGVDRLVELLAAGVLEFKALTIFSFLFGVGIAIQFERATSRNINARYFLLRRSALRFPIDLQQPYFRNLADHVGAGPGPVTLRVLPYSFTLDESRDRGLSEIAASMFGAQTRVMLRPSLPYGEDPKSLLQDLHPETGDATVTAVLFNLAATPEQENHGALLAAIARQLPGGVTVLADESSMTERATGPAATMPASLSASRYGASSAPITRSR